MFVRNHFVAAAPRVVVLAALVGLFVTPPAWGGGNFRQGAVGGVMVDAKGVLSGAKVDDLGRLRAMRLEIMQEVPADLDRASPLRMISLKNLEAAIAERQRKAQMPIVTDAMNYLAGMTRVQYVFVYPEHNDIVLAGPAEGWKVDQRGFVVGAKSGRPTLQLDQLLEALRNARAAANGTISCSIDPTQEGVQRFQRYMASQSQFNASVARGAEQALGMQTITLTGIPPTSDFARVLVAADYRMKRLAMGLDKSPLPGLPSYLSMISGGNSIPTNAMPRWWLAPKYEALLKDPEGLAWELRGAGVQCLTEDSIFAADGQRQQTGRASAQAQKWADTMTARYEELCQREPVFGDLRNVMDLAVVSALIVKENLTEKAGFSMPLLTNPASVETPTHEVPKLVESQVSALKKGRRWVISASGGVEINSWQVASNVETGAAAAASRKQAQPIAGIDAWWWD